MGHCSPPGCIKTTVEQHLPAFSNSLEMEGTMWVVQGRDQFLCHDRVATWMADNESPQLAQYAASLPRVALRRPNPPMLKGRLPTFRCMS